MKDNSMKTLERRVNKTKVRVHELNVNKTRSTNELSSCARRVCTSRRHSKVFPANFHSRFGMHSTVLRETCKYLPVCSKRFLFQPLLHSFSGFDARKFPHLSLLFSHLMRFKLGQTDKYLKSFVIDFLCEFGCIYFKLSCTL